MINRGRLCETRGQEVRKCERKRDDGSTKIEEKGIMDYGGYCNFVALMSYNVCCSQGHTEKINMFMVILDTVIIRLQMRYWWRILGL